MTPSRNNSIVLGGGAAGGKTPGGGSGAGDRLVPDRNNSQFDLAHFLITSQNDSSAGDRLNQSTSAPTSPNKLQYQQRMRDALNGGSFD